jgi:hypothetical protein
MAIPQDAVSDVTLWYRKNSQGAYEFNHMADGHCESDALFPSATVGTTRTGWSRGEWVYEHAWLDGSSPPKVLNGENERLRRFLSQR